MTKKTKTLEQKLKKIPEQNAEKRKQLRKKH